MRKRIRRRPVDERFWEKVNKNGPLPERRPELGPCWMWTAWTTPAGYGQFGLDYKKVGAHRVAYELLVGPIPEGLYIDHLCRNPSCVNPSHLEPVTPGENVRRGDGTRGHRKTHCKHGHEFTIANSYIDSYGHWNCRTCSREKMRRRRAEGKS